MKTSPFLLLLAGFAVWSAAFLVLYAVQATGCHLGWHRIDIGPTSALRWLLIIILLLVLALLAGLLWLTRTARNRLRSAETAPLMQIAMSLQAAAFVATVITYGGVSWLMLC